MPIFVPGQFKQALQNKIKGDDTVADETPASTIKKTDPTNFTPRASDYHKKSEQYSVNSNQKNISQLPKESPLNKSVHQRMMGFVKEQYGNK